MHVHIVSELELLFWLVVFPKLLFVCVFSPMPSQQ
jgi:hypothetical protein